MVLVLVEINRHMVCCCISYTVFILYSICFLVGITNRHSCVSSNFGIRFNLRVVF